MFERGRNEDRREQRQPLKVQLRRRHGTSIPMTAVDDRNQIKFYRGAAISIQGVFRKVFEVFWDSANSVTLIVE